MIGKAVYFYFDVFRKYQVKVSLIITKSLERGILSYFYFP